MIEPTNVKGFQDFLPPESLKREKITKIIEETFRLYGFLPVETPLVEFDELMRPDNIAQEKQDEAVSDRFRLQDRAGRNLGLRYEFTFQLQRILKQNPNLKLPFKRYQIGPVFRDEPVTSSRFRQFTQCDADIVGDSGISADAECLSLVSDILKSLEIESEIQINNRKLLQGIIESVEITQVENVMKELDKLEKIGEDGTKSNLKKYTTTNQILTLFRLLEKPLSFFLENSFEGADEVESLIKKSKLSGVEAEFNPFLVRGLSYYTGNIFEVKEKGKDSIAAGGRYDKSVGKYSGREIPAVGISFGLERVANISKIEIESPIKALLISIDEEKETLKLAKKIRKEKIPCVTTFGKPGKQLEYANSLKIPYAVFIGSEEVQKKKFKLRDMNSGSETMMTEKQLIKKLS